MEWKGYRMPKTCKKKANRETKRQENRYPTRQKGVEGVSMSVLKMYPYFHREPSTWTTYPFVHPTVRTSATF